MSCLEGKVAHWWMNGSYQRFKKFITKLIVVNDCAERGVKLIQEFVDVSSWEFKTGYYDNRKTWTKNCVIQYSLEYKLVSNLQSLKFFYVNIYFDIR